MKAAELKSRLEELVKKTEEASQSKLIKDYLDFCTRFHEYSYYNILSILFHCPTATRVAGYKTWQKLGRSIKKGEKGIPILAPAYYKEKVQKAEGIVDYDEDGTEEVKRQYFIVVYVFDVEQTYGASLPETPDISVKGDGFGLLNVLEKIAQENNIKINYVSLGKNHFGTSKGGEIEISKDMENTGKALVLIHELAHEFLHKKVNKKSRAVKEAEAEAVAYVIASQFGIDGKSDVYLALWNGKDKILDTFQEIKETVDYILVEIEKRYKKEDSKMPQQE